MRELKVLKAHVVFLPLEDENAEEKTPGGLVLLNKEDRGSKRFLKGKVVFTGADCAHVKVGDTILYPIGSVFQIDLNGEVYRLIGEDMIFAIESTTDEA